MHRSFGQSRPRALRLATLALAMSDRGVTLAWLRNELGLYTQSRSETGRQQFERDKVDLQEAGVPIETTGSAYRAVHPRRALLTTAERDALSLVQGRVADPATGAALGAFAATNDAYPDLLEGDRVRADLPDGAHVDALVAAIVDGTAVAFDYEAATGPLARREVEPWGLRARRGLWYLVGHDRDRDDHRVFRLDRVAGEVETLDTARTPRPDVLPSRLVPGEEVPVTFRLDGRGALDLLRLGGEVDLDTDGPQVVVVPAVRDETALALALANDATLLSPPALEAERARRAQVVEDLHLLPTPVPPAALDEQVGREPVFDEVRLRRLLALPGWLSERAWVTLDDVSRAFAVDEAELVEDLGVLRDVVLPGIGDVVDTELTVEGAIHHTVAVTVPLRLDALDRARVAALVAAASASTPGPDPGLALLADRLERTAVVSVDPVDDPAMLALLRDARASRRTVTFLHRARGRDRAAERRLTPTRLDWHDGHAYVGGFDHDRGDARWFRLDRVARLAVTDDVADVDAEEVALPELGWAPRDGAEVVELVLRCTHVGAWVLRRTPPLRTHVDEDGLRWGVVRTDTPGTVLDHVLIAAGEAEVVAPADLRRRVADRAAAVA